MNANEIILYTDMDGTVLSDWSMGPVVPERNLRLIRRFVEAARFTHLGVFAYQAEDGTPAAALPDQVPMPVREERRAALMELQADISAEILAKTVGSRLPILVDAPEAEWPGLHRGRVWFQAPEADGTTWTSGPGVTPGALVECDIVESSTYDLSALAES